MMRLLLLSEIVGVAAISQRIAWGSGSSNPRGGSRGDADGGLALKYPTDTETKKWLIRLPVSASALT